MGSDRLQQWLLRLGLVISAVLLIRFAIDFSKGMKWWLAVAFCLLVIVALGVGVANVFISTRSDSGTRHQPPRDPKRALLLAAIPLGFIASSLDCMGLSLQGCSRFCTFVKLVWIPLMAAVCAVYFFRGKWLNRRSQRRSKQGWLTAITVMSFVPLVPHCVCYNVGNAWWIDRIGASPLCYGWGFLVSIIAIGALRRAAHPWPSVFVCFVVIAGSAGFFVSHHYFHFPW